MVKFKLRGNTHNTFPIKYIKKLATADNRVVDVPKKEQLRGDTVYDSDAFGLDFEEIKKQLGDNIIWTDQAPKTSEKPLGE